MAYSEPNGFRRFYDLVASGAKEPSRSNLFSVFIGIPPVLRANENFDFKEYQETINYFADSVTVPGRRITTGQVRDVGAMRRFATDTAFGDAAFSFILTKDMYARTFFERWMNYTASDAENRVTLYDQYTTNIIISKWESGSGVKYKDALTDAELRLNRVTGVWQMYGAFPYDMSAMNLTNGPTDLIKVDVKFYYERYRFDTVSENISFDANKADRIVNQFSDVARTLGIPIAQADVARYGI